MTILCGTDIVEIRRIKRIFKRWGQSFGDRIFTKKEIEYCENKNVTRYQSYSARFAAKEALVKALGTGIGKGVTFKDVEVLNGSSGKPYIKLNGRAKEIFDNLKGKNISLSLSHCDNYAIAYVIIEASQRH